jgi:hypothetical protein
VGVHRGHARILRQARDFGEPAGVVSRGDGTGDGTGAGPARRSGLDFAAQSEEREQLVPADLREPPKPIQLFIWERLRSQERPPTSPQIPRSEACPSNIRLIFGEYYGDPFNGHSPGSWRF